MPAITWCWEGGESAMEEQVFIRINGVGHAVSRELGCPCDRCRSVNFEMATPPETLVPFSGWDNPPWRAHTSASILFPADDGSVKRHILIDVGAGVVDSLVCSRLKGLDRMEALLLTHWHPDHVLGLNQLCESLRRSATRSGVAFQKIPLFCTLETYEYLRDQGGQAYLLENHLAFEQMIPEQPFEVGANPVVRFTPIPVAHGDIQGSVIFVADIGSQRVVFAWDIDVPSKAMSNGVTNQEVIERNRLSLARTRLLFLAANTWAADDTPEGGRKRTGHTSYRRAQSYVDLIKAEKTYLTHMSGHEDGKGHAGYGWTDSRWESAVQPEHIEIARQGMVIEV